MAQQHTHEFDCPSCGAHIDSREELDRHNRLKHPDATRSSPQAASGGDSAGEMRSASSNPSDQRS
jgi:hypothetical protein